MRTMDVDDRVMLISDGLHSQISDWLVDRIRQLPKTWREMTEQEQREVIESAISASGALVRATVNTVAADERKVIVADLDKVEFKDGIKAQISCSRTSEYRHELSDAQGQQILIVVADADKYMGGDHPEAEPDQPPLFDRTAAGAEDAAMHTAAAE